MRLRHADRQFVESQPIVERDLLLGLRRIFHSRAAVYLAHDRLDLFLDAHVQRIKELKLARLLAGGDHRLAQRHRARAAFGPVIGHHGIVRAGLHRHLANQLDFRGRIMLEAVHRHHHRNSELSRVLDHLHQIRAALFEQLQIFFGVGVR